MLPVVISHLLQKTHVEMIKKISCEQMHGNKSEITTTLPRVNETFDISTKPLNVNVVLK